MWVRIPVDRSGETTSPRGPPKGQARRSSQQPHLEALEDRQLLTASLQSITESERPCSAGLHSSRCSLRAPPRTPRLSRSLPAIPTLSLRSFKVLSGTSAFPTLTGHPRTLHRHADFPVVPELDAQHREHDHQFHE